MLLVLWDKCVECRSCTRLLPTALSSSDRPLPAARTAVCPAQLAPPELLAAMANTVRPVPRVCPASPVAHHPSATPSHHHHATLAHLDLPDLLAHKVMVALPVVTATLATPETMAAPDLLDLLVLLVMAVNPVVTGTPVTPAAPPSPLHPLLVTPVLLATVDLQVPPAPRATMAVPVLLADPDPRDHVAVMAAQERTATPAPKVPLDPLAQLVSVVSAPNIVLLMVAFSSKMALGDKRDRKSVV